MTDPTLTTHSDTAPWTRLVRIDASGLAATRRCLGYLLRSLVRAVDKDRIGEHRLRNLPVWQIPARESQALAALAQRSMQLQVTVQDGSIWVGDGSQSVEINLQRLMGPVEG